MGNKVFIDFVKSQSGIKTIKEIRTVMTRDESLN